MKVTSFEKCCKVEQQAWSALLPLLKEKAFDGRFVFTDKGRLSKLLQKIVGDAIFNDRKGTVWSIEVKAEKENKHGNFFLETWSNRKRYTPGWMFNCDADMLWYFFLDEMRLFAFYLPELKWWAFAKENGRGLAGRIWDFPAKRQSKYEQMNDTWGRCVPIAVIVEEVRHKAYDLTQPEDDDTVPF